MVEGVAPETAEAHFQSQPTVILHESEIIEFLDAAAEQIEGLHSNFTKNGSNWILDTISYCNIILGTFDPLGGSTFIPLPDVLQRKKAVVNVKNVDKFCFVWSVLAQINPAKSHKDRQSQYKQFFNTLNLKNLTFPLPIHQISKFEMQNPDISINAFYYSQESQAVVPQYLSKFEGRQHVVNLLIVTGKTNDDSTIMHYTLITSLSRLLSAQHSNHHHKIFPCLSCLHCFSSQQCLSKHAPLCRLQDPCRIEFPLTEQEIEIRNKHTDTLNQTNKKTNYNDINKLYFKNYKNMQRCPFVIYADFESLLVPHSEQKLDDNHQEDLLNSEENDFENPFINDETQVESDGDLADPVEYTELIINKDKKFQFVNPNCKDLHVPSGVCCLRVSAYEEYNNEPTFLYSGPDVLDHFFDYLNCQRDFIDSVLSSDLPCNPLTEIQRLDFTKADRCSNCNRKFDSNIKSKVKCIHHDHITGKYIGPTCNRCNLALKCRKQGAAKEKSPDKRQEMRDYRFNDFFIPVVFHNSKNYDSHIIIKNLEKRYVQKKDKIHVIANNKEKYISFQIGPFKFIDSLQFLNSSLETLVTNLKRDGTEKFLHLNRHFSDEAEFNLLTRKGVFCYEYMTGFEKFYEKQLPSREAFNSCLSGEECSPEDYLHAKNVWNTFNCQNIQNYHDLYLKTDVLLLADVFENFRTFALTHYRLDPAFYLTIPSLAWDAMLKMTNVCLELYTEPNHLLRTESGIRGGVASINCRYAAANNKYCPDTFDPQKPNEYLIYLDANNLYGWAMSQPLPYGDFKDLTDSEITNLDIMNVDPLGDIGYFVECDLSYPNHLHAIHNDYPLAPETIHISEDMLSPFQVELRTKLCNKTSTKIEKLCPNFYDKKNYFVHFRNLQFYIRMGLEVTKIHSIMQFKQSCWLEKYINFNTEQRKLAKSTAEKDQFKLLNNSVFGKTMLNLRRQVDVRLVTEPGTGKKLLALPTFSSLNIINKDVTIFKMKKSLIKWRMPTYVGFSILDISKLRMYDFHYNFIKTKYGSNAKLLFTDTDSLAYSIKTDDIYADLHLHSDQFDFSDYPKDHFCYDPTNSKVLGKFKDENLGILPIEFVGLRAKMYSILEITKKEKSRAKGIKTSFLKHHLRHENYKRALFDQQKTSANFYCIRSQRHQLMTVKIVKDCLNPYDDKRYLLEDNINTLAYGHIHIKK